MSDIKFSDEQVQEIYQLISGVNSDFINRLANEALKSMAEVQRDMINEHIRGGYAEPFSIPDTSDIRTAAVDFTKDMMKDFTNVLTARIEEAPFTATVKTEIDFNLTFN